MQANCLRCGSRNADCKDSRLYKKYRRRRYMCTACGHRWSTIEVPSRMVMGRTNVQKIDRILWAANNLTDEDINAIKALRREGDS